MRNYAFIVMSCNVVRDINKETVSDHCIILAYAEQNNSQKIKQHFISPSSDTDKDLQTEFYIKHTVDT